MVVESLTKLVNPSAIVLRNDVSSRQLEGLESSVTTVMGEAPEKVEVREGEARFEISPLAGQKIGGTSTTETTASGCTTGLTTVPCSTSSPTLELGGLGPP